MKGINQIIALIFLLLTGKILMSQTPVMWEPEAAFSIGINDRWSGNGKIVLRYPMAELGSEGSAVRFRNILMEGQGFINYRLVGGQRLTLGLLYGISDPFEDIRRPEFRIIEQYSFRSIVSDKPLSHRIRLEQRFRNSDMQQRLRYRITTDFPLQGSRVDPGEWYAIAGSEVLYSFNGFFKEGSLDNRTGIGIGHQLINKQRLQLEIQGRFTRLNTDRKASAIHLITTYLFNL